jgi:hypothetical protein
MDELSAYQCYPRIIFRVLHDGSTKGFGQDPTPWLDDNGDLSPREPDRSPDLHSADVHLSWQKTGTPFTSFCNWEKACKWIKFLQKIEARNITLLAIDTRNMPYIFDAFEVAQKLGYSYGDYPGHHPRRRLEHLSGEFLVRGGYSGDSYRLLAVMPCPKGQLPKMTIGKHRYL